MILFFRLIALAICFFATAYAKDQKPTILVSVAAYQDIVAELAGNELQVLSVVPAGVSFHTFEPTPSHVISLSEAKLWFTIGAPFEKRISKALQNTDTPPAIVDLRIGLRLLHDSRCSCCEGDADTHIWTSPRMMKIQLKTIRDALIAAFPNQKQGIAMRYDILQERIDHLISYIDDKLSGAAGKLIVIAHGAYDYLCRDYGIEQCAIEVGGKEATARSLHELIQEAKARHVKTVFSVKQYPKKGIDRVAEALEAKVIEVDAYQPNYFTSIVYTADMFHNALEEEI